MHACSHFGARVRRHRSLNILTAREPMDLSSRRRLILLASYRRERRNSSRIAREIENFSILAWLFPTLVHIGTRQSAGSRSVEGFRALRGRCRLLSASGGARAKKTKKGAPQ